MTTATTRIERSGPAVRAALAQLSPAEGAQFETEFADAIAHAGVDYDLASAQRVLDRSWGIAVIRAASAERRSWRVTSSSAVVLPS